MVDLEREHENREIRYWDWYDGVDDDWELIMLTWYEGVEEAKHFLEMTNEAYDLINRLDKIEKKVNAEFQIGRHYWEEKRYAAMAFLQGYMAKEKEKQVEVSIGNI